LIARCTNSMSASMSGSAPGWVFSWASGSTGPRHLFAFGLRPEDGLTDWALLVTERSPLTIVHVAEPTAVAVDDWDCGVHDA
jgi:hypothetical protein